MMAENGISLLPSALPEDLGRGHPLLFDAAVAVFLKLFGNFVFNAHLFALIISFLTVLTLFRFCEKFTGKWSGVLAVAILLPQPVFLAQSCLVLPEIALSLFILLSFRFYLEKKTLYFLLSAGAAILIKESAIVLFATISALEVIRYFKSEITIGILIKQLLVLNSALSLWGLHLLVHRYQYGTFFFHEHVAYISFEPKQVADKFQRVFLFVFLGQGRNILLLVLTLSLVYAIFKKIKISDEKKVLAAGILFLILFSFYSSVNYFSDRYLCAPIIIFILLFTHSMFQIIRKKMMIALLFPISFAASLYSLLTFNTESDHNLGYTYSVKLYSRTINYIKKNLKRTDTIYAYFNMNLALGSHYPGYLDKGEEFTNLRAHRHELSRYYIFSSVENADEKVEVEKKLNLQLVWKTEKGKAWVVIMKRK
jgi:hypothetical protein